MKKLSRHQECQVVLRTASSTAFFGIGQAIGPSGAGLIARFTGSFTPAYYVAAFMTAGAAILAATIAPPKDH